MKSVLSVLSLFFILAQITEGAGANAMALPLSTTISVASLTCSIAPEEMSILMDFYHSTNGDNWLSETDGDLSNDWDINNPIENWFGLTIDCNGGFVEKIEIPQNNNLDGSLPASLGSFTKIRNIQVDNNPKLIGKIPSELGNLSDIVFLSFRFNNLSGGIPEQLSDAQTIRILYLSGNNLTGSIPNSIANLSDLHNFFIDNNQLDGLIPDLTGLPLNWVLIQNNRFQFGDFEDEFDAYNSINVGIAITPQIRIGQLKTKNLNIGDTILLSVNCSGKQNEYQWYKDNIILPGWDTPIVQLTNVQLVDDGVYHCEVTSDLVSSLVIYRKPITINIVSSPVATEGPGGVIDNNVFWVRADAGVAFANNDVASWVDQSDGGNDALQVEQAYRPSFNSNLHNYNPGVYFDGSNEHLSMDDLVAAGSENISVFAVGTNEQGGDSWHSMVFGQSNSNWLNGGYGICGLDGAANSFGFWVENYSTHNVSVPLDKTVNTILEGKYDGDQIEFYLNAYLEGVDGYAGSIGDNGTTHLGGGVGVDYNHKGYITEVAIFDTDLNVSDRIKVNSYLGVKYAITLDRTGVAGNYLDSDGQTIYESDLKYWNNIIGIAQDVKSTLLQKQSHLASDSTRIYLSNLANRNLSNTGSFTTDKQAVMMGSDHGELYATALTLDDKPTGAFRLIDRTWKVTNTNFDGTFSLDILFNDCAFVNPVSTADFRLLIDDDGDFTDAQIFNSLNGITFMRTGNLVSIKGISNSHIPENSAVFITLGAMTNPVVTMPYNQTLCAEGSIMVNGTTYDSTNPTGLETLTSSTGCDSLVSINLTFANSVEMNYMQSLCIGESVLINGTTYDSTNPTGLETVSSSTGCDSLVSINLIFVNSIETNYMQSLCAGESILINGTTYDSINPTGIETLATGTGCDSLIHINLSFGTKITTMYHEVFCLGGSVLVNGVEYNAMNPTGIETLTAATGCDSVVDIELVFLEEIQTDYIQVLCDGESIEVNGVEYDLNNTSGTEVFQTAFGCDSVVNISIEFWPITTVSLDTTICIGTTIEINGVVFGEDVLTGMIDMTSVKGCDSLVLVNISFYDDVPYLQDDTYTIFAQEEMNFSILDNDDLPLGWTISILSSNHTDYWVLTEAGVLKVFGDKASIGEVLILEYEICNSQCDMLCETAKIVVHFNVPLTEEDAIVSEVLTLNNDGKNDVLSFRGANIAANEGITIFNRWGDLIFSEFPYQNRWDGKNKNGDELPNGTYYYVLYLNRSEGEMIKGDVLLVK